MLYWGSDDPWVCSGWQHVTNVILQGSITLNIFINHWRDGTESLTKLAGDIELRGELDISEERDILPDILEE